MLKRRIYELRSALGDRPKTPRYIETVPRRGYRFIAAAGLAAEPDVSAPLVTHEHRDPLQRELLGATRERMLREIAEALEVLTAERPLLLIF